MSLNRFSASKFITNQLLAINRKKGTSKIKTELSIEAQTADRLRPIVLKLSDALDPKAAFSHGDEDLEMNVTFMGLGAKESNPKLNSSNIDQLEYFFKSNVAKALNVIETYDIETKGMSTLPANLLGVTAYFVAAYACSLGVKKLATPTPNNSSSTTPVETKAPAVNSSAGVNLLEGLAGVIGGTIACFTVSEQLAKNKKQVFNVLAILATAQSMIKQAPTYRSEIILVAAELLHSKAQRWASSYKSWEKAILRNLGPFPEPAKTPIKAEVKQSEAEKAEKNKMRQARIERFTREETPLFSVMLFKSPVLEESSNESKLEKSYR